MSLGTLTARRFLDPVLSAVFPAACPGCHTVLAHPSRGPLCDDCWSGLPRHCGPLCRCGFPLPSHALILCGRCRRGLTPFDAGASLGPYERGLRILIHELKYRGRRRVAGRLADLFLHDEAVGRLLGVDAVLVPVPLHSRRRRERGFNQSELLARELARRAGLALAARALVRLKDTPPQTGLSAAGRRRNVRGAFAPGARGRIAGRAVVLVDDVLTTGATVLACATALRAAGAAEVRTLTVARVV